MNPRSPSSTTNRRLLFALVSALAATLVAADATAGTVYAVVPIQVPDQPVAAHSGFYVGMSLGTGGLEFTNPSGNSSGRENSLSLTLLRFGLALNPRLLVGVNLGGWGKSYTDASSGSALSVTMARMNAELTFYPIIGPFDVFVRGGLGYSRLGVSSGSMDLISATGTAAQLGGGIEKRLGSSFAIGASLDLHGAKLDNNVSADYWEMAAQLTWY